MKKTWRPDGFTNPFLVDIQKLREKLKQEIEVLATQQKPISGIALQGEMEELYKAELARLFETGASALLEALRKTGAVMTSAQMRTIVPDRVFDNGVLVFIPDDEEVKE